MTSYVRKSQEVGSNPTKDRYSEDYILKKCPVASILLLR
jgi:hypothetical protein